MFNFVQDSSIQSKDYTSFSYNPLVILHRSTNRAITPTPSIALTRSREPTLRLSKDNFYIFMLISLIPFIVTTISLKYSYSKLTNTSTLKKIRLKIKIKLFRPLPSSKKI